MQSKCNWKFAILFLSIILAFPSRGRSQEKKVIDSFNILLQKAEKGGDDKAIAEALSRLALTYSVNEPDRALKISEKQLALSKKSGYKWGVANAYYIQGGVYEYQGNYDKALELFHKSLAAFDEIERKPFMIDVNNSIGIVYFKKGIYSEALKYLLDGLKIAIQLKDNLGIFSTYNNIGYLYEAQKQYDEALKYYIKSLAMQRKSGQEQFAHITLENVGKIYLINKQPTLALDYFNQGVKSAAADHDDPSLARNYAGIGNVYIYTKEWQKALEYHNKAYEIRKRMDDGFELTFSYLSLGEIYYKTKDFRKALDYTIKARDLVNETGELDFRVSIYDQLSKIYDATGNYRLAYTSQKLYKQYADSIFNSENTRKLTEQQMNFDFKLKEEKKDAAAKQALNIRNYTIGGILLVVIFGIMYFRQRYRLVTLRKQKAHEVAMQKLENEMAVKDLESQALRAENENSLLKEEKLQEKLDFNNRELASATMYLYQKNEMLSGLRKEVGSLDASANTKQLEKIRSIIQNDNHAETDWERFRIHFEQVHPDFFKNLTEKHPGLTPYEVRLCAYLHLKMANREIAGLLNITPESVIKAKVRLNKKLNTPREDNDTLNN